MVWAWAWASFAFDRRLLNFLFEQWDFHNTRSGLRMFYSSRSISDKWSVDRMSGVQISSSFLTCDLSMLKIKKVIKMMRAAENFMCCYLIKKSLSLLFSLPIHSCWPGSWNGVVCGFRVILVPCL